MRVHIPSTTDAGTNDAGTNCRPDGADGDKLRPDDLDGREEWCHVRSVLSRCRQHGQHLWYMRRLLRRSRPELCEPQTKGKFHSTNQRVARFTDTE